VELVTILCRADGPGDAALAQAWQQQYDLQMAVWGDTTDYMYANFAAPLAGSAYPSTMVVDLDSMTLREFEVGQVGDVEVAVQQILDAPHPCADR